MSTLQLKKLRKNPFDWNMLAQWFEIDCKA